MKRVHNLLEAFSDTSLHLDAIDTGNRGGGRRKPAAPRRKRKALAVNNGEDEVGSSAAPGLHTGEDGDDELQRQQQLEESLYQGLLSNVALHEKIAEHATQVAHADNANHRHHHAASEPSESMGPPNVHLDQETLAELLATIDENSQDGVGLSLGNGLSVSRGPTGIRTASSPHRAQRSPQKNNTAGGLSFLWGGVASDAAAGGKARSPIKARPVVSVAVATVANTAPKASDTVLHTGTTDVSATNTTSSRNQVPPVPNLLIPRSNKKAKKAQGEASNGTSNESRETTVPANDSEHMGGGLAGLGPIAVPPGGSGMSMHGPPSSQSAPLDLSKMDPAKISAFLDRVHKT